ncbi:hypothetical protein BBK14_07900 [Parafrankia soli]|uniref:DUF2637 domain-containing protein n=1 Tax=Parafrankia soli TaxID=2599596 RepID=A0A1S1PMN4_9ACTN|nr:hypothetical protein [Parafrankia soli]OHV21194.1 hypothetical protein BBK14_07900 [Parafrankia soli]
MKPAGKLERLLAAALPFALGAAVFVIAFWHIVEIARWAGQPDWAALLIASTGECMAVAAILEILARRRTGIGVKTPVLVLVAAVLFSGAVNLAAALVDRDTAGRLAGEPGAWRPVMAVWPVMAFALVAALKATRGGKAVEHLEEEGPAIAAGPAPGGAEVVEVAPVPAPAPPAAPVKAPPPAAELAPGPDEGGSGATPRGSGRLALAELVANLPADDPRSERQLAADLAPAAGLAPATARRYLADLRKSVAA